MLGHCFDNYGNLVQNEPLTHFLQTFFPVYLRLPYVGEKSIRLAKQPSLAKATITTHDLSF